MARTRSLPMPCLLVPALLALAPAVAAQDMINNLPDYTSAWVMGDLMQRRGRDFEDDEDSKPRSTQRRQPARSDASHARAEPRADRTTLLREATYAPSPAVESRLDAAFADYLAGQRPDGGAPALLRALAEDSPPGSAFARLLAARVGTGGDAIRGALGRGELQHDYAGWLASMGYSERNLFDVHTAFLMHTWAIANDGVMTADSKAAFAAVRDDLVALQARDDAPRTLSRSDARKQEEAQSFALLTALLVSAWQDARGEDRSVLRQGVAALGRRIGIDYRQVALTRNGFETR